MVYGATIEPQGCIFCGAETPEDAKLIVFPETFTAYQLLQAGDKACERCAAMFADSKFRRNSWIVQDGVFTVLKDPLEALLSLPDPPFTLYLTKTKRKHGWIRAVQNPALNVKRFILVVDEEKIIFQAERYADLYRFARNLYARRISKSIMLGGMPEPSVHRRYGLSWAESFRLRELQHDPLWRTVVEFKK